MNRRILIIGSVLVALLGCQGKEALDPETMKLLTQLNSNDDLIVAHTITEELPLDPLASVWAKAQEVTFTLVSQTSVAPHSSVVRKTKLAIRALHNKKELGLLLSWRDATPEQGVAGAELFRDAVAVAVPLHYGTGIALPYIGMGDKENPVNIWHWKASWQADMDHGFQGLAKTHPGMIPNNNPQDFLTGKESGAALSQRNKTSPVENLLAAGFGSLTSTSNPQLQGHGLWQNGQWQIVIKSRLKPSTESAVNLTQGNLIPITFALWDGARAERNGMKGITRWRFLQLAESPIDTPYLKSLAVRAFPTADAARGKTLITKFGCTACHALPGGPATSQVGPDLTHAGSIHRPEYLLESIKAPNAVIVPAPGYYDPSTWTSTMPSYGDAISEQDYRDLAAYLRTLQ